MKNQEKYGYLSTLLSLLSADNEDYDHAIENLSRDCKVPEAYMRNTINLLKQHPFFINSMDCDSDTDKIFHPECMRQDGEMQSLLSLSPEEYNTLSELYGNLLNFKRSALFETKRLNPPLTSEELNNRYVIDSAIMNHEEITFQYRTANASFGRGQPALIRQIQCTPYKLNINIDENSLSVTATDGNVFRLDRMRKVKAIPTSKNKLKTTEGTQSVYVWGTPDKHDTTKIHVRLKIQRKNENHNLFSKIEHDTALRTTKSFKIEGNTAYYEDDIIGLDQFRKWMRKYGSSITVLEPIELRNAVIENAKKAKANYEKWELWKDL